MASIGKSKDPIKINGSIGTNQILYAISGIESRRLPYSYFYNGNININLYGLSIPLSYTFSNQQSQFQQPFNQYGIQPSYKWIKGYAGYSNMVFSPYSLNGHIFLGGGVDLSPPGLFRFSAMYGRLQKAVEEDSTVTQNLPMYQRMGYGLKAGIGKGNNFLDLVLFHAHDLETSLKKIPVQNDVLPSENLVLGFNFSKAIAKRIVFSGEYARSAFTRDVRSVENVSDIPLFYKATTFMFTPRSSTSYYNALRTNVTYTAPGFSFGIGYEKIDPNYRTLGAYYFNNDLENITLNTTKKLFKSKVNIASNIGVQRNNLNEQKVATMRRFIGSFNINYSPSSKANISVNYSNFQTFTRVRPVFEKINQLTPFDNLDTLNYVQLTQSAGLNSNYIIGDVQDSKKRQNINASLTYQVVGDSYGSRNTKAGTVFYNGSIAYSYFFVSRQLNLSLAANTNISKFADNKTTMLGPTFSISKSALENKLRTTISSSWNKTFVESAIGARIFNIRLSGSYTFLKKHNFNTSLVMLNRNKNGNTAGFTEFTGIIGYVFNF